MTSPWRFGIVLRRPQTWQLWEPTSSRGDIGVSSALAELLFVEIQPKSMQLARSCALRVARPMRTVIVRVHMHTRAIKRTNRLNRVWRVASMCVACRIAEPSDQMPANDALRNYSSPFTVPYRKGTLLAFNRTLRTADASNMYLVKRYSFAKVSSFRATASRRIEYPTTYHRNLLRSGIGNCCIPNDGAEANETLCGVDRIARNFFPI